MIEVIRILLDAGLTISADNGTNLSASGDSYIYQESHKGCMDDEDYKIIIKRFLNDNDIEL